MMTASDILALNETIGHEAPEAEKVAELAASMQANGWQGAPVLTYAGSALTGTHRIAAARQAGINIETLDLSEVTDRAEELIETVRADNEWADTLIIAAGVFAAVVGEDRAEELGLDLDVTGLYVDEDLI